MGRICTADLFDRLDHETSALAAAATDPWLRACGLVERYMFISTERYGADWLWIWRTGRNAVFAPYVPIIFVVTLYGVLAPIISRARAKTTWAL